MPGPLCCALLYVAMSNGFLPVSESGPFKYLLRDFMTSAMESSLLYLPTPTIDGRYEKLPSSISVRKCLPSTDSMIESPAKRPSFSSSDAV